MTDAKILQMPNKVSKKTNPYLSPVPEGAKETDAYPMTNLNYTHSALRTVPDLATGGNRNKKWGAVFTIGILPGLGETRPGPALVPNMPAHLIDSESLEGLRERIVHELDKAIALAKLQVEDPVEFQRCETEFLAHLEKMDKDHQMGI